MELRQLRYFIATYEEASMTLAARRLNVVQPALSQQLSKLEAEVGEPLFLRTPKGMVPTLAGEEAYELFLRVMTDLDVAKQTLSDRSGKIRGRVSIGVVSSVSNNALSETLQIFNAKYPEVKIRTTGGYTTDLTEMLRTSQVDFIVVNAPPHLKAAHMTDILTEDLVLICAETNPQAFAGPVTFAELETLELVIPSKRHGLRLIIDQAAATQGVVLQPALEFDELKTIEDFIQDSRFFTVLPPTAVHRAIRQRRLRYHLITPAVPRRLVCSVNPGRPLSKAAELLVEELCHKMVEVKQALDERLAESRGKEA